jgi:hypothetical protein
MKTTNVTQQPRWMTISGSRNERTGRRTARSQLPAMFFPCTLKSLNRALKIFAVLLALAIVGHTAAVAGGFVTVGSMLTPLSMAN